MESVPAALRRRELVSIAHHEAGHVVLMEWCGIPVRNASVDQRGNGVANMATLEADDSNPDPSYNRPRALAHIAAVYHAGIMAEMLYLDLPWRGITARLSSTDWESASFFLRQFSGGGLAGHGFAQLTARAVLSRNWGRVEAISTVLLENGVWSPDPDQDRPD